MEKKHKKGHLPIWAQLLLIILCGVIASVGAYYLTQKKIAATREAQKPRYTVTFAYQNGSPIATRQVKEGCGTFPPDIETNGVFQGWNGAFNEVMADIEVHPMCYELNGDENLFCFNAVYAQEGTDFAFDLRLSGNVNISKAQIEIEFDSEVMDYVQATPCEYCKVEESGGRTFAAGSRQQGANHRRNCACLTHLSRSEKRRLLNANQSALYKRSTFG